MIDRAKEFHMTQHLLIWTTSNIQYLDHNFNRCRTADFPHLILQECSVNSRSVRVRVFHMCGTTIPLIAVAWYWPLTVIECKRSRGVNYREPLVQPAAPDNYVNHTEQFEFDVSKGHHTMYPSGQQSPPVENLG